MKTSTISCAYSRKASILFAMFAAVLLSAALLSLVACSPNGTSESSSGSSDECAWSAGYEVGADGLVQTMDGSMSVHDFCLSCHDDGDTSTGMDWDIIHKATADWKGEVGVNPHESHLGATDCSLCHADGHSMVMYCNNCHDMEL